MMMSARYDAPLAAGADQEIARKAAEAAASHDGRRVKLGGDLLEVEGEFALLAWMVGFNLALTAAVLAKLLV